MSVTFAELHDAMKAFGLEVGLAQRDERHAVTITDSNGSRSISIAVRRDFDHAARVVVLSMVLRERLALRGHLPDLHARDDECRGRWPEFLERWPAGEDAQRAV